MESYSAQPGNVFQLDALRVFNRSRRIVERIQSTRAYRKGTREYIRCHEVTRVVHELLLPEHRTVVVDGKYGGPEQARVDHSWLEYYADLREGYKRPCILDVYCAGRLPMVQLIDAMSLDQCILYTPGDSRNDIDEEFVQQEVRRQQRG